MAQPETSTDYLDATDRVELAAVTESPGDNSLFAFSNDGDANDGFFERLGGLVDRLIDEVGDVFEANDVGDAFREIGDVVDVVADVFDLVFDGNDGPNDGAAEFAARGDEARSDYTFA